MRPSSKVVAVTAIVGLMLAACTTTPAPREGGSASASLLSDPSTLDPRRCGDTTCGEVIPRLFDSLTAYDPRTAELEPAAAESWDVNEDATMLTFTLREGATFHDGEAVTAESFVRSLTSAALKKTASEVAALQLVGVTGFGAAQSGRSDELPGVRVGDAENELVIELDDPNPEFLNRTAHTLFSPLPAAAFDDPDTFREQPVGNGPYRMASPWQHNESISVEQYEDYDGDLPGFLEGITWEIGDVSSAYISFQDGDLDVSQVPPEQYLEAEGRFGDAFVGQATAGSLFLVPNHAESPTSNADFLRAVSMGINRDDIVQAVFDGQQVPADSIVPPATPGHRAGVCAYCSHDIDRAKDFLDQAGGPPEDPIVFTFVGAGTHDLWVDAVRNQLRDNLGIESEDPVIHAGGQQIVEYLTSGEFPGGFLVITWLQDYPSLDNWLFPTLHSEQDGLFAGYSNPEYDQLVTEAQRTVDDAARISLYNQAEDLALEEMAVLPMWYDKIGLVYNDELFHTFVVDVQQGIPAWEEISLA